SDGTDTGGDTEGDTDGEEEDGVVTCDRSPQQSVADGTCEVTGTGANGSILLRGTVLGPDQVLRGGEVLIDGSGMIRCVACDGSDAAGAAGATTIECPDGVISPGLINSHDHITYVANEPIGRGERRYEHRHDWRVGPDRLDVPGGASVEQV